MINSGCANACTGEQGLSDAQSMMRMAADVGVPNSLVMSTGVIGPFLDLTKIQRGLTLASAALTPDPSGWDSASRAIMTTDTVPKLLAKSYELGGSGSGKGFRIAGMCKGAGMIHPNMATMLGVVTTDAAVSVDCLKAATRFAVDRSFNAISVDGDMSTNDTVAVLANGQSQHLTKADGQRTPPCPLPLSPCPPSAFICSAPSLIPFLLPPLFSAAVDDQPSPACPTRRSRCSRAR